MRFSVNLNQVYQSLFIALVFLFPLTVSGGTVLAVSLIVVWLFSGNYRSKFEQIISNKLSLACIAFFALHLVGLLWTEDLGWGLHMVKKMYWLCLGLPILLTITQEDSRQKYLSAFLFAMTFSEICSYLIWFEVVPPFKHATVGNPTPFIDHISYNPLLAFAVYLLLYELLINKGLSTLRRYAYVIFAITMSVNMFITGGRAGHVMYFSMLVIIIFQYFEARRITAFFTALIVIPMVFFLAYQLSPLFKVRTDSAIHTVSDYLRKELNQADGPDASLNATAVTTAKRSPISLSVYETEGVQTTNGANETSGRVSKESFEQLFDADTNTNGVQTDYGTDGPGSVAYALSLVNASTSAALTTALVSGLYALNNTDTSTTNGDGYGQGDEIMLSVDSNGNVVGKVGTTTYFTIAVDNTTANAGDVTFTQTAGQNIWHSDTIDHNGAVNLALSEISSGVHAALRLTQVVTDADGDTDSAFVDLASSDTAANVAAFTVLDAELGKNLSPAAESGKNLSPAAESGKNLSTENSPVHKIEARFNILGTGLGQRMTFVVNSYEIVKDNWLYGVGTGDFPSEYKVVNKINTPSQLDTVNPHNMYVLEAVQFGVLGLVGLWAIFYYQFKIALASQDRFIRDVGVALPVLFMIIMLAESYLLGHNSTYLFVIFSAFLYKNNATIVVT